MSTALRNITPHFSLRAPPLDRRVSVHDDEASRDAFRAAFRRLASGVSVVTTGYGAERTGFTATSVSSLSVDPPRVLVLVNRESSSFAAIVKNKTFGINFLAAHQKDIAQRFSGFAGVKGEQRYAHAHWTTLVTGTCVLAEALASFDCEVEEIISRHSHGIVIGRALAVRETQQSDALLYWGGQYQAATTASSNNI